MAEMDDVVKPLDQTRAKRLEQTGSGESPTPKGGQGPLAREVEGHVMQSVYSFAMARTREDIEAIQDPKIKERVKHVKSWVIDAYNTRVKGRYENEWRHHADFETDLLNSFITGFRYFVQVGIINDRKALKRPDTKARDSATGRIVTVRAPSKEREIIAEAYEGRGTEAIEAYTFEKLKTFGIMFFRTLSAALKRGISRKDTMFLLEHEYGLGAHLFDFENDPKPPYNLDTNTIVLICKQYPAQALLRLKAYENLGPKLIAHYWGDPTVNVQTGNKEWISSPAMIRRLIFSYPDTIERGLEIVEEKLTELVTENPQIPRDILIETCAKHGSNYEKGIQDIHDKVTAALDLFTCSELLCDAQSSEDEDTLFRYLQVERRLYQLVTRKETQYLRILTDAKSVYEKALQEAKGENITLSFRSKRRIMRALLSGQTDDRAEEVVRAEQSRGQKERDQLDKRIEGIFDRAQKVDPLWGIHYAIWGGGDSFEQKMKSGAEMITDYLRHYAGDEYVESLLDSQFKILGLYMQQKFPTPGLQIDRLKEALLVSPRGVKKYYEDLGVTDQEVRGHPALPWPEGIEEVPYDDSWEYELAEDAQEDDE